MLHVSDSGITADNGDTLRLVRDAQGRLLAAQAPDGQTINYVYDASGELSSVVHSSLGTLYRYGYDALTQSLDVAVQGDSTGTAFVNSQATGLAAYLGSPSQFDGTTKNRAMPAGGEQDYAFSISDAEIRGTNAGTVIVRVVLQQGFGSFVAATPELVGLEPLSRYADGSAPVALFEIAEGGTYLFCAFAEPRPATQATTAYGSTWSATSTSTAAWTVPTAKCWPMPMAVFAACRVTRARRTWTPTTR